ncbi:MAG TPA: type VI secretion system-associated protein TagF [Aliidongia sp.]|nr:type VI secretion system-associated protein TagF [Aliidongia sp.]
MILVPSRPPGYYGKVPARGDFVSRRLARSIVDPWDDWLQQAIQASQEQLGSAWIDLYLVAPIWRFVLAGGLCGPAPLAGILMPSVDSVGRNFPLLIAVELPPQSSLGAVAGGAGAWFEDAESMALDSLRDGFKLEDLDRPAVDLAAGAAAAGISGIPGRLTSPGLCVPLSAVEEAGPAYGRRFGDSPSVRASLWWTIGSERIRPVLVAADGLPAPSSFAAFLDGDWQGRGWTVEPAAEEVAAPTEPAAPATAWDRDE